MHRVRPRKRKIYHGRIILDSQPTNWIKKHRSFASKEWFESQIRYGTWMKEQSNTFLLYVTVPEGIRPLLIQIKFKHYSQGRKAYNYDHVLVYHAHVLRKKK